jgi:hypothetical protein
MKFLISVFFTMVNKECLTGRVGEYNLNYSKRLFGLGQT